MTPLWLASRIATDYSKVDGVTALRVERQSTAETACGPVTHALAPFFNGVVTEVFLVELVGRAYRVPDRRKGSARARRNQKADVYGTHYAGYIIHKPSIRNAVATRYPNEGQSCRFKCS